MGQQRHDDVAVLGDGLLTDDHQIAIVDTGVAHAFAGNAERKTAPIGGQATFDHHFAQNVLFRQDRMAARSYLRAGPNSRQASIWKNLEEVPILRDSLAHEKLL